MDNLLHKRVMEDFGRGYLNPHKSEEVFRALYARIDKAEARVKELEAVIVARKDAIGTGPDSHKSLVVYIRQQSDALLRQLGMYCPGDFSSGSDDDAMAVSNFEAIANALRSVYAARLATGEPLPDQGGKG